MTSLRDWTRDPEEWLPEFQTAIVAIGRALQTRQPTPELLFSLRDQYSDVVSGHKITVEGSAKTSRNRTRYVLWISGDRFKGSWSLTNSQLRDAVNAACPDFPIRSS